VFREMCKKVVSGYGGKSGEEKRERDCCAGCWSAGTAEAETLG